MHTDDPNGSTLPPEPHPTIADSIKTGVDETWNQDARQILIALIRSGAPGAPAVESAVQAADALAAARHERGGIRKEDQRQGLSEYLELAPVVTEAIANFIKEMRKLDKDHGDH